LRVRGKPEPISTVIETIAVLVVWNFTLDNRAPKFSRKDHSVHSLRRPSAILLAHISDGVEGVALFARAPLERVQRLEVLIIDYRDFPLRECNLLHSQPLKERRVLCLPRIAKPRMGWERARSFNG
jgi:hypothetical protein